MRSHETPDEIDTLIDWATNDVYQGQDSASWSPYNQGGERLTAWAIEQAQGIVDNGGFRYFFEKDWPDHPEYFLFVEAFQRIGALEVADCLQDAIDMFPFENPHLDCLARNSYLDSLREKQGRRESVIDKLGYRVLDLGGETFVLLAGYILKHIEAFPTVKKNLESNPEFRAGLDETMRRAAVGIVCDGLRRLLARLARGD
jgi:hypothetical protein